MKTNRIPLEAAAFRDAVYFGREQLMGVSLHNREHKQFELFKASDCVEIWKGEDCIEVPFANVLSWRRKRLPKDE